MKGLILSGGKGTRLLPLTYNRAKQLIPVANKPVLVRVIESIRDAGITEIGIVTGDTHDEVKQALSSRDDLHVNLTYIRQASPDGLAHAVKISQDFLNNDSFVMFLGDNVIEGGISPLIRDFDANEWNSQIVLKRVENPTAYGVAALKPDGSIDYLVEKPKEPPSDLALVGIYMFDPHIFEAVNSIKPSGRGEYEITDAIQWLMTHGYTVYPHEHKGWWIDTGKAVDMLAANDHVLDELKPLISADTKIENSRIDPRVTIEPGAQIINSTLRGPTIIGRNTVIKDSYIGPYTSIYHDVVIENCEVEHSIVLENSKILHLKNRLQDSLIGRNAKIQRDDHKPKSLKMNLGDYSNVWIPD